MKRSSGMLILILTGALLIFSVVVGTLSGAADISLSHAGGIIARGLGLPVEVTWRPWEYTVLWEVRLPRVLVGLCVGGGLALCGAALQGLFRNPLAGPGILGVSSGASLGAVLSIYLGWTLYFSWALPLLASVGAGVTAFTAYAIATRRGRTPMGTLLLAGVALNCLNAALVAFVLSLALANYDIGKQIVYWTLGGLDGRTWEHVKLAAPVTLLGTAAVWAHARDLDALLLGETQAASVGVDVARVRRRLIAVTSLVTGVAVAVSGAIGFVGLVIPHLLRLLLGPGHRWLLPASTLLGAGFLVLADWAARTLIAPEEIRLGVVTAVVGAPFFLFLLLRHRKEGLE